MIGEGPQWVDCSHPALYGDRQLWVGKRPSPGPERATRSRRFQTFPASPRNKKGIDPNPTFAGLLPSGSPVATHFMHYNFVRIRQSPRVTPAMAAGVTNTLWSLTDMVQVIEEWEAARLLKISGETMVG